MKKLLIIQKDEAYFLFETIQVIEKNYSAFQDFQLTLLVNEKALKTVYSQTTPILKEITYDDSSIDGLKFDISVNLSLDEASWKLHGEVNSEKKLGVYLKDETLQVNDLWSSFLLTLKSKAPFLTFHLQDIYKNILGIKSRKLHTNKPSQIRQFAFGMSGTHVFPALEQEKFIENLSSSYPLNLVKDISEIDLVSDVSSTLYIGPPSLEALKLCESGAKAVFISSGFRGFNLLPYESDYVLLSSQGKPLEAESLMKFISAEALGKPHPQSPYAVYRCAHENIFGAYLQSTGMSDDNYPFYQSHVVLWNFLLNLSDADLDIIKCSQMQIDLLKSHSEVLAKFIRLHDYAMASVDNVYNESKTKLADATKIDGHIQTLLEIEKISDQIASSHPFLRPFIDFYRIRRGQNQGCTLLEQAQTSFLNYAEEHQALQALQELFSVTLKRNEVNI